MKIISKLINHIERFRDVYTISKFNTTISIVKTSSDLNRIIEKDISNIFGITVDEYIGIRITSSSENEVYTNIHANNYHEILKKVSNKFSYDDYVYLILKYGI
jgi:hypothetical protein